jgi:hypothetical protein
MTTLTNPELYILGYGKENNEFTGILCGRTDKNEEWARQFMAALDIPVEWEFIHVSHAGDVINIIDPRAIYLRMRGDISEGSVIDSISIRSQETDDSSWAIVMSDRRTEEFHYLELSGSVDTPERVAALEALGYVQVADEEAPS